MLLSWRTTVVPFQERRMARCKHYFSGVVVKLLTFLVINVLLVDNHKSMERVVKPIDAVLLQTELVTLFYTPFTANPFDTIPTTLSSISHLT